MILLLIFVLYFSTLLYFKNNKSTNNKVTKGLFEKYKWYIENEDINISSRKIIKNKENYEVFIGKNEKEIENGYYDLYINIKDQEANIYINKLFKEYEGRIYDSNYLIEIVNYLDYIFDIGLNDSEKNDLTNTIEKHYNYLRGENIEKQYNVEDCNYNKFKIVFKIEENLLKIVLSKR